MFTTITLGGDNKYVSTWSTLCYALLHLHNKLQTVLKLYLRLTQTMPEIEVESKTEASYLTQTRTLVLLEKFMEPYYSYNLIRY